MLKHFAKKNFLENFFLKYENTEEKPRDSSFDFLRQNGREKDLLKHVGQSMACKINLSLFILIVSLLFSSISVFDMVNVHLFHDASNLLAVEKSPSIYSQFRKHALEHTLRRYEN